MWLSAAPRRWPSLYQQFCELTLNNSQWWDTGDKANAVNRCPQWMRREPSLLSATREPLRQGTTIAVPSDGSRTADWGATQPAGCRDAKAVGGYDCRDLVRGGICTPL